MSNSFLWILVLVISVGALLAAWAGIRSIQSARSVVFYRTRQARMLAGRQWLGFSLAMVLFVIVAIAFGNSLLDRILSPASVPTTLPEMTLTLSPPSSPANNGTAIPTATEPVFATETPGSLLTATSPATPSHTPSYLGTYTALAVWTERRSTFIAMLSFTPTASRTPIPTWTRTRVLHHVPPTLPLRPGRRALQSR